MPRTRLFLASFVTLSAMSIEPLSQGQEVPSGPPEAWADPGLKVTRGLALWLDAGRLNAARKANGRPEASDGSKVDVWYDASGHGRDVVQRQEESQPLYQEGALRFDGETSFLERAGAKAALDGLHPVPRRRALEQSGRFPRVPGDAPARARSISPAA